MKNKIYITLDKTDIFCFMLINMNKSFIRGCNELEWGKEKI